MLMKIHDWWTTGLSVSNPSFEEGDIILASCGRLPITEYMTKSMVLWTVKSISIQHHEMRSTSISVWRRGRCSCCTWTLASVMGFTVLRCGNSPLSTLHTFIVPLASHIQALVLLERRKEGERVKREVYCDE